MIGVNKVIFIGNAGSKPEFKTLNDGTPVAKMSIATTDSYRLKTGELSTKTEWHPVVLWRGLATLARQYIRKGSHVYIEGKLTHRQYPDKDGQKKYVTEVVADRMVLLDKREKALDEISEEPFPF